MPKGLSFRWEMTIARINQGLRSLKTKWKNLELNSACLSKSPLASLKPLNSWMSRSFVFAFCYLSPFWQSLVFRLAKIFSTFFNLLHHIGKKICSKEFPLAALIHKLVKTDQKYFLQDMLAITWLTKFLSKVGQNFLQKFL